MTRSDASAQMPEMDAALGLVRDRMDRLVRTMHEFKREHGARANRSNTREGTKFTLMEARLTELADMATALRIWPDGNWPGYGFELSRAEERVRQAREAVA